MNKLVQKSESNKRATIELHERRVKLKELDDQLQREVELQNPERKHDIAALMEWKGPYSDWVVDQAERIYRFYLADGVEEMMIDKPQLTDCIGFFLSDLFRGDKEALAEVARQCQLWVSKRRFQEGTTRFESSRA